MRLTRPGAFAVNAGGRPKMRRKSSLKGHLDAAQLRRFLFGESVGGEDAGADLAAGEKLQAAGHAQVGIDLEVQVSLGMRPPVRRRLVDDEEVRHRLLEEKVEPQ